MRSEDRRVYTSLKDVDQALIYLKRSQLVARKRNDKAQLGASLTRIGELYEQKQQPDKAINAFKQALPYVHNLREDWVIRIEAHLRAVMPKKASTNRPYATPGEHWPRCEPQRTYSTTLRASSIPPGWL
ncbi:tetratricopeptide repeat protein [Spirosoma sp. HMF4905]|uniref:Tetratricopeptide repeat protein n=1 Tax=Spirosoma arboris TaxID=2682092 RepID=A0A7K1SRB3_9BACT|nr:tetratricopeptide repeat protein [Spirosoma arboris]MVM36317.1 tetratricopeptide repeat protein [Spirosoma arboris]